ncbi:MAG: PilW family protein [Gammaproteobacteria bacterium]
MKNVACKRCSGFTLVELMIALLISMLLTGAVIYLFVGSNKSYKELSRSARMQEDASFALHILKQELTLVNFFGSVRQYSIALDGSLGAVSSDCSGDAAAYDFTNSLLATQSDGTGKAYGCISDALPATTVLVVKHTGAMPLATGSVESSKTYLLANHEVGVLYDGADTPPTGAVPDGRAWEYQAHAYYIQDQGSGNPPSLSRKALSWNGGAMAMQTQTLITGVEEMRLLFGVDSDADGNLDSFLDAATINSSTTYDWDDVVAVQIYLLVRTDEEDHTYTDARTYNLGTGSPVTRGDKFHRTVINTTVSLRNPQYIIRDES